MCWLEPVGAVVLFVEVKAALVDCDNSGTWDSSFLQNVSRALEKTVHGVAHPVGEHLLAHGSQADLEQAPTTRNVTNTGSSHDKI